MKKFTLILLFLAASTFAFAQGQAPLSKGQKQMNFGLGLDQGGLPVYFGMDWAVHNDITVGGTLSTNLDGFHWLRVAGKGDYHFNRIIGIPSNFDFYAGVGVGFNIYFNSIDGTSGLHADLHVGGRWFWSDKWGLNLELGGGSGFGGLLGLTMKM